MPGTGLFPDVGVAHLLCNLEYEIGVYIALTGARLRAGDLMWSGLVRPQVSFATVVFNTRTPRQRAGIPLKVIRSNNSADTFFRASSKK